ncbi:MAG: hypothetical protein GXO56_08270 [Chloroflexi bacterium]|nr:hypothetical protein [Chloroflexota bacterium]
MSKPVKFGLLVGAIGLVTNACISALLGLCGPGVSLIAGAVVGYLIGHQAVGKAQAGKDGALGGAVAGVLLLVGQIIGGLLALVIIQHVPSQGGWLQPPSPSAPGSEIALYYMGGLGAGVCFGLIDIAIAALGGTLVARWTAQEEAPPPPPPVLE